MSSPVEYYMRDFVMDFDEWKAEQRLRRLRGGFLVFSGLCLCLLEYWVRFQLELLPGKELSSKVDVALLIPAALSLSVGLWVRRRYRVSKEDFEAYEKTHKNLKMKEFEHRLKNTRRQKTEIKALLKELENEISNL